MSFPVLQIDAFTERPLLGNPAGVVLDSGPIPAAVRAALAREFRASETAFVERPHSRGKTDTGADLLVGFYTGSGSPIPFCGHATVALGYALAVTGRVPVVPGGPPVTVQLSTPVGRVPIRIVQAAAGRVVVTMTQRTPEFKPATVSRSAIAAALGTPVTRLAESPIELASTGNWHLLVPVTDRQALDGLRLDRAALATLHRAHGIATTHVYAKATPDELAGELASHVYYTRNFAPSVGIDEDPVTGSASGAHAAWLAARGLVAPDADGRTRITFLQGHALGRPGQVDVTIVPGTGDSDAEGGAAKPQVLVSGTAAVAWQGELPDTILAAADGSDVPV